MKGAHQSRNSYIARALREAGIMRELGEGMRRIFELMKSNELAPPELKGDKVSFSLLLHHRPMYAKDEIVWLEQFDGLNLSSEQKSVILMGRKGDLIAPNDIIRKLGIVDIEHYRQIVNSLQKKLIFITAVNKNSAQSLARKKGVGIRDVPRFAVKVPGAQPATRPTEKRSRIPSADIGDIDTKMLYVANIPYDTNERDIIEAFKKVGEISSVIVPRIASLNKGYAFIQFLSEEDAKAALDTEIFLGGRRLVIRWKEPKKQFTGSS